MVLQEPESNLTWLVLRRNALGCAYLICMDRMWINRTGQGARWELRAQIMKTMPTMLL